MCVCVFVLCQQNPPQPAFETKLIALAAGHGEFSSGEDASVREAMQLETRGTTCGDLHPNPVAQPTRRLSLAVACSGWAQIRTRGREGSGRSTPFLSSSCRFGPVRPSVGSGSDSSGFLRQLGCMACTPPASGPKWRGEHLPNMARASQKKTPERRAALQSALQQICSSENPSFFQRTFPRHLNTEN